MALAAAGAPALAALREARITSVPGFGQNAEANAGRSLVNLSTLPQAGAGEQSDPTEDPGPTPRRAPLPKPFQAAVPEAPPVVTAPAVTVTEKTDEGTKGSGGGNPRLVRNSPDFSPDTTILPGTLSGGAGAGGGFNLFKGIRHGLNDAGVGFGARGDAANGSAGGGENGGGENGGKG
jgi:hypothetical protein